MGQCIFFRLGSKSIMGKALWVKFISVLAREHAEPHKKCPYGFRLYGFQCLRTGKCLRRKLGFLKDTLFKECI